MIRTVSISQLGGYSMPGIEVRDHFRKVPENLGGPHYCLGPLRTLAETTIEGHSGFPMHAHRDMEIVSYVCEGQLSHHDTLGKSGRLAAGDMQVMTTGTGIRHSEYNDGDTPTRMYQLWIEPTAAGLPPDYVDVPQPKRGKDGKLGVLVSGMATRPGGTFINQDAAVLGADLAKGESVDLSLGPGRQAYVVAARGRLRLDGTDLPERDGAIVTEIETLTITALDDCDVLIVDVAR